jgi:hypothetical protein
MEPGLEEADKALEQAVDRLSQVLGSLNKPKD